MQSLIYQPLADFLGTCQADEVQLRIADIERILARPLPHSAHDARWWTNTYRTGQGRGWLTAGWRASARHLRLGRITFTRLQNPQPNSRAAQARVPFGQPLVKYLEASPDTQVALRFGEVEQLLGHPLPASARQYGQWWNDQSYWYTRRLRELGWHVSCSLAAQTVTFTRP